MALEKNLASTQSGDSITYWNIGLVTMDLHSQRFTVHMYGWPTKTEKDAGQEPYSFLAHDVGSDHWPFSGKSVTLVQIYVWLKSTDSWPLWQGATDA